MMMNIVNQLFVFSSKSFFFVAMASIMLSISGASKADDISEINDSIRSAITEFNNALEKLPPTSVDDFTISASLNSEINKGLEFARESLAQGNIDLAIDSLMMTKGIINTNLELIKETNITDVDRVENTVSEISNLSEEASLNAVDLDNIDKVLGRMNSKNLTNALKADKTLDRLTHAGYNFDRLKSTLSSWGISMKHVGKNITLDASNLNNVQKMVSALNSNPGALRNIERELAKAAKAVGASLNDVATTVAAAIQSGISVDLTSVAKGLGFDSFAAAVQAYNDANGTSYSTQQARDALGQ